MAERPAAVSSQQTKDYLVGWCNNIIRTKYLQISSLEQLATGVTFCQLLNILYPNRMQIAKVYIRPKNEFETQQNFKLLAQAFQKIGLRQIEVAKMVKGRYPDLLGLLLYLKKLLDDRGEEESRTKVQIAESTGYDRSQHQSPNRYTLRPNQRNESPMRLSMRQTKIVSRKPKTELQKKQEQLEQAKAGLLKRLDLLATAAENYQGNSLQEFKKILLALIEGPN